MKKNFLYLLLSAIIAVLFCIVFFILYKQFNVLFFLIIFLSAFLVLKVLYSDGNGGSFGGNTAGGSVF